MHWAYSCRVTSTLGLVHPGHLSLLVGLVLQPTQPLCVFRYSLRMPMSPLLPHKTDRGDGGRQLEIRGWSLCQLTICAPGETVEHPLPTGQL